MENVFPCGARGRAEFCPGVCQYGKFCKIYKAALANQKPRGVPEQKDLSQKEEEQKQHNIEMYY